MKYISSPEIPARIIGLKEIAGNLWWNWQQEARLLFKGIDRPLWKSTGHNPVKLLQQVPRSRLESVAANPEFLNRYDSVFQRFKEYLSETQTWVHTNCPRLEGQTVAYFSMEYALHNSLPIYAGGLGVLAGDHCKEASDLGLPLVAIGFMYPQGYFQQRLSDEGRQEEIYRRLNFAEAPIAPVLDDRGERVKINVELDSSSVSVVAWQVKVGRVQIYLLDTDLKENPPEYRQFTARLYGGNQETRIQQEIVLGIGGVRMLRALGVGPSVWHANEGHAAFMMLERCRELTAKGMDFTEALDSVKATTVFTTHTPVPAGNDAFPADLLEKCLHSYRSAMGLGPGDLLKIGAQGPDDCTFNMTMFGMRMARYRNGVSNTHGAVCRQMWRCLWPDLSEQGIPITSITNGIHVPSWVAPQMANVYKKYIAEDWTDRHDDPAIWENIDSIPDEELWTTHLWLKRKLIDAIQIRARKRWMEKSGFPGPVIAMGALLDSRAFTIGFSRRFTGYKRASLIMYDVERLKRILQNALCPVQIVFSGKAHPRDEQGKRLIQEAYQLARDPDFGGRIAFVEDYDIHMARYIIPGVDVWLNTPLRLLEASGTSGMKAAINGVPNLSVLDGWWCEGYNGENGWTIGDKTAFSCPEEQDEVDADALYRRLEDEIVPLYYDRDVNGIPHGWMKVVKQAICSCLPLFSTRRMVKEYARQMYEPAAQGLKQELLSV